ncbi:uncharacterized protein LOC135360878 isoform X2 [Latimeria chalumnae]|uniref:uncharacterized protein LOC135360878 isoform X2 n=1 Tax=Latimeria chalumnae TaxID=7897 RepID=UPI00313D31A4
MKLGMDAAGTMGKRLKMKGAENSRNALVSPLQDYRTQKCKGRCSAWETSLKNQLTNPSNFEAFLEKNMKEFPKLSESCVISFPQSPDPTAVSTLMKALNKVYDDLQPGTRKIIYKWLKLRFSSRASSRHGFLHWTLVTVATILTISLLAILH